MKPLKVIVFAIIFLIAQSLCSDILAITCDKSCSESNDITNVTFIERNESLLCCFSSLSLQDDVCDKPSPLPLHINATYLVDRNNKIGISSFWIDTPNALLNKHGYHITVSRDHSSNQDDIYLNLSQKSNGFSLRRYDKVYFQYNYFPNDDLAIHPGYTYHFTLGVLPSCKKRYQIPKNKFVSVNIPDCINDSVKQTKNCKTVSTSTIWSSTSLDLTSTSVDPPVNPPIDNPIPLHLLLILLLILLLFLGLVLKYLHTASRNNSKKCCQNLLVVISSWDTHNQTPLSIVVDRICCFLRQKGFNVVYTMWHTTTLSQTNVMQWLAEQVELSDEVFVIISSGNTDFAETSQDLTLEPLLNVTHDPLRIVSKMMEAVDTNNKYSLLCFDNSIQIPSTLINVRKRFYLPKEMESLCAQLFNSKSSSISNQLKEIIQQNLA